MKQISPTEIIKYAQQHDLYTVWFKSGYILFKKPNRTNTPQPSCMRSRTSPTPESCTCKCAQQLLFVLQQVVKAQRGRLMTVCSLSQKPPAWKVQLRGSTVCWLRQFECISSAISELQSAHLRAFPALSSIHWDKFNEHIAPTRIFVASQSRIHSENVADLALINAHQVYRQKQQTKEPTPSRCQLHFFFIP